MADSNLIVLQSHVRVLSWMGGGVSLIVLSYSLFYRLCHTIHPWMGGRFGHWENRQRCVVLLHSLMARPTADNRPLRYQQALAAWNREHRRACGLT
jgi:hypothetical protein